MLDQSKSEGTVLPLNHHILSNENHASPKTNPYVFWDLLLHPLKISTMFLVEELEVDVVLLEG
jgi:hypothetical protein